MDGRKGERDFRILKINQMDVEMIWLIDSCLDGLFCSPLRVSMMGNDYEVRCDAEVNHAPD